MHYGLDYDKFELVQTPDQGNNTRFESPVLVELTLINMFDSHHQLSTSL